MDRFLVFTKNFKAANVSGLVDAARKIGVQGLDMAVRPGYVVNPDNVRKALPVAAAAIRSEGLVLPMVSTPVDFVDPDSKFADDLWAACHDSGVENIKIGYWAYDSRPYEDQLSSARRKLEKFAQLGSRYGIKCLVHTHSGKHLGLNVASALSLTKDFNPFEIGVYVDPGHLAINGEPQSMGLEMPGERLAMIGIKDVVRSPKAANPIKWVPLGEGEVDWKEVATSLNRVKYRGWLSFFCEFESTSPADLIRLAIQDVARYKAIADKIA